MTQPSLFASVRRVRPVSPLRQEIRRRETAKTRLLAFLQASNGAWVSNVTLANPAISGLRFGGRIYDLRRDGWQIETRADQHGGKRFYRLIGRKEA